MNLNQMVHIFQLIKINGKKKQTEDIVVFYRIFLVDTMYGVKMIGLKELYKYLNNIIE